MEEINPLSYSAFNGYELLAQGQLADVAIKVKRKLKTDATASILIFSDSTGKQMDFDLRGSEKEILRRLQVFVSREEPAALSAGPGRPKLGVVAREVSLLPRHWEWLSTQSGGASAALRRLVEDAKKDSSGKERIKDAQDRTYKFVSALAGNLPNYEEALRALYRKDKKKFKDHIAEWPHDVRTHSLKMAAPAFETE